MALKTDYKDDILDSSVNVNRTFSIIDNTTGQTIYPNVSLEETTVFSQEGDSHTAQITNEQNTEINQINNDLSTLDTKKGNAQQIVADISATTGIEVGRWIKNNVSIDILQKGFTFNFIPTQTPGWWSGQMFADGGSTWWGYYMNRDTNTLYKYVYNDRGADSVTPFKQDISLIASGFIHNTINNPTNIAIDKGYKAKIIIVNNDDYYNQAIQISGSAVVSSQQTTLVNWGLRTSNCNSCMLEYDVTLTEGTLTISFAYQGGSQASFYAVLT